VRKTRRAIWSYVQLALLLLVGLAASKAHAQVSSSVLTGNVVDASTKAPIADVVVTATAPTLQGEQVVVTDSTGLYRVPQLPPGTYTLRFEKETYRPFSRTTIDVPADRTLRLNVELLPETAGTETVTVVGTPPTVDVGSSTTGNSINQDFVRNLALSRPGGLGGANRSFDSIASTAPQATNDVYGVGISGGTSPENQYLIDGLSVNDPAYGVLGTPLTIEFVDEVNVLTGGYMPEYGRSFGGGTISAVTKSGGNEFHGSVWGTFTPGSLTGPAAQAAASGGTNTVIGKRDLYNIGDFGATLGGYIIKDKLWFFAGIAPAFQRYSYTRQFQSANADQSVFTPIANSEQRRFGDEKTINYIAKLTYLINSDHRVSVTVNGTPTSGGSDSSFAIRQGGALQARAPLSSAIYTGGTFNSFHFLTTDDSLNVNGELNSSFLDKRLLVDVRVGWHHQKDAALAGDGSGLATTGAPGKLASTPATQSDPSVPVNLTGSDTSGSPFEAQLPASVIAACAPTASNPQPCPVTGWTYGSAGFIEQLTLDSIQAKGTVTYLLTALGHHVVKAGVDANFLKYDHQKAYTGTVAYGVRSGSGVPGATGQTVAWFDVRRFGFLSAPDVPVTIGVAQAKTKSQIIGGFVQDSWSILDKVTLNVGLRYDSLALKGDDGVTRIALNDQVSPRIGVVWDPTQQGRSKIFANYGRYYENIPLDIADRELSNEPQIAGWHNINCNPLGPNGVANCDAQTLVNSNARPSRLWRVNSADQVPVDNNLKSPSSDEVVVGGEYEIIPNARLGATYTYRNLVRTVEDMSNDEANTYFIGNPGEGIADTFPKAKRTYHSVTVQFAKTFADLWMAQVSYTWAKLTGNYDGLYRPEDNQLDPNLNSTFDLKSLLLNQEGPLGNDITHTFKVYVAKEFVILPVLSVTLGASFTANSGTPINYLGAQVLYGPGQAYILERGSGGRLPWVTSFDGHVGVNYRFTKDLVLTAFVDGFNLFNSQRPLLVDNNYTFDTVGPINPNGKPGSIPAAYGGLCADASGPSPDPTTCASGKGSLPRPATANGQPIRVGLPDPTVISSDPTVARTGAAVNINWGRPTQYQAVRTFRFGLRVTF
jgi:hypothetical protein